MNAKKKTTSFYFLDWIPLLKWYRLSHFICKYSTDSIYQGGDWSVTKVFMNLGEGIKSIKNT